MAPFLSGPEPFIKPLVKSVRAEFKPPSRALYDKVREDIMHRVSTLNQPVTLDILPVTAVHVAPVLPPVSFGSLSDFGRRLGLSEISALDRQNRRQNPEFVDAEKTPKQKPRKKTLFTELHTPQLSASLPVLPSSVPVLTSAPASAGLPASAPAPASAPNAGLTTKSADYTGTFFEPSPTRPEPKAQPSKAQTGNSRVRKFSPEIISREISPERRSLTNSSVVEIFPDKKSVKNIPRPKEGVRVTLDMSVDAGEIGNLLEIEELLSDAERLLGGQRISEEEISRELKLLEHISDSSDLRNTWSDIEAELDKLRSELNN